MSSKPLVSHAPASTAAALARGDQPARLAVVAPSASPRRPATGLPLFVLLAIPTIVTAWGLPYYTAAAGQRLRHPLHPLLKASGPVGLAFGLLALLLFLFMWLYPLRKQARWQFRGLIGLGMLSMVVVSLSGIVGRYLYTHLPRSRSGLEMSLEEAGGERRALLTQLAVATGMTPQEAEQKLALDPRPYDHLGLVRTFARLVADDFTRWRTLGRLKREWSRKGQNRAPLDPRALGAALRLARLEMKFSQQMRALEATRRVFAWWHVAHRPFALTALFAILIHVAVAVWVGGVRLDVFGGP
jgi:hypothetical protein